MGERYNVSRESLTRLEAYVAVLCRWQQRINLIGPSTVEQVWTRHVADALQLIAWLPPGTREVADLGAGAGIPGLVLALAAGCRVHLYESNGKKAAFLGEAIRVTGANAVVHPVRIETLGRNPARPRVQVVTARALAPLPKLLELASPWLAEGAVGLFHKGQDVDAELTAATKYWKMRLEKHPSEVDSTGVILEVKEVVRV